MRALLATLAGAFTLFLLDASGCGARDALLDLTPARDASADRPALPVCGTFDVQTQPSDLELFIAMDTSGSMKELTVTEIPGQGIQKLDAVRAALKQFLNNPESSGIGVTFSFFPRVRGDIPALCTSDETCGLTGACKSLLTCFPTSLAACAVNADCPPGETCEPLGVCGLTPSAFCAPGYPCDWGQQCMPGGWCENHTVCDPSAYEPDPPTEQLPQAAAELSDELDKRLAQGGTPTLPAIRGVVKAARMRQEDKPKIKTIVLLATDGFPTLCDPALLTPYEETSAGIPGVAKEADAGRKAGVETFVVGVFSSEESEMAQSNLDTIALAGSGMPAYIITTDQIVTDKFLATLNEIRKSASACDYVLPRPDGVAIEAKRIQVKITSKKDSHFLQSRGSLAECDPKTGGFVFDKDPSGPEPPARIQLCPESCGLLSNDSTAKVEVVIDCVRLSP